jgi:predicted DCC family thiol-disulfide oxidoreductase YuxK
MSSPATAIPESPALPDPESHPQADVVIYDGHCRFCRAGVERLHWWDGGARLAFISLHDPRVAERYPDLSHEQLMAQMYVVDAAGNRYGGADAIRFLTRRLPWFWPIMPLVHIPFSLPLWQWLYDVVASRRYLFGKTEECDGGTCSLHFKK